MKLFLTSLTLMIISAISVFGQNASDKTNVCTNQTAGKISSRGISLGMSLEETVNSFAENNKLTFADISYSENNQSTITPVEKELQPLIGRIQEAEKKNFGFASTVLIPKDKERFDGIAYYYLSFLDNRLASFSVNYLKPNWENQEQFIRKLSEILNLPVKEDFLNNDQYSIKCGDYTVEFRRSYQNKAQYSMSVSKNVNEIVRQRMKKIED